MKRYAHAVILAGGLSLVALLGGCASGASAKKGEPNYSYLDDQALEKFDADLTRLSAAIQRSDASSEASLRRQIGEQARQYQAALISALSDGTSVPRRRLAGVALGFTGDIAVIGPLLAKVNDRDEPESVRHMAVLGLATLDKKLREYPRHDELMQTLRGALESRDTSASMRRSAVQAYAAAYDRVLNDSISPLRDRFMSDPDMGVKITAINVLGDIGDTAATQDLIGVGLGSEITDVRMASAIALGKIQDARLIVPALVDSSLDDESAQVRREAVNSLATHFSADPDTVHSALLLGLSDFNDGVREASALALARTADVRAIDPLLQATGDRTAIVRRAAAEGLGLLLNKEREISAYPLVDLLSDQTPEVRKAAQVSLAKITTNDWGDDQARWRSYFYKTYPVLDPANAYAGQPKPRMTTSITGGGARTSSSRPSSSRPSTSRPSSSSSGRSSSAQPNRSSGTSRNSGTARR
ncbi:HEAT repeat domain-containing protein [bacterium]|nr:MAG: HEAT repeat domain-containing protein [bacterium]RIK63348.1 MAG: hypothetical protein DCC64_07255 [Planctomycetota bacterium]